MPLLLRQPRTSQPQGIAQIDQNNPLAVGLVEWVNPAAAFTAVRNKQLIKSSGTTLKPSPAGLAFQGSAASAQVDIGAPGGLRSIVGNTHFTLATRVYVSDASSDQRLIMDGASNGATPCVLLRISAGVWEVNLQVDAINTGLTGGTVTVGWHDVVLINNFNTNWRLIVDGVVVATYNYSGRTSLANGVGLRLMANGLYTPALGFRGQMVYAAFWNRAISDAECKAVSSNPWQLAAPLSRQLWIPDAAAGPTYALAADNGALSLAGQATGLTAQRKLVADTQAFALSGQTAGLTFQRTLAAAPGNVSLSGQAASLTAQRKVVADTVAFALAGQAATLTYTPIGGPTYTLVAASASVALAGQATGLTAQRKLVAATQAFSLAGQATTLARGRVMPAASGDYAVVGNNATLLATRKLAAESAATAITGSSATLTYSGAEPAAVAGAIAGDRASRMQVSSRPSRQQAGSRPTR